MLTLRRRSIPSRRFLVPSLTDQSVLSPRLRLSFDRWWHSPLFRLLSLLCLGYASADRLPQLELSLVLALAGVASFLLGLVLGWREGELRSRRVHAWTLRLGLSLLLLLGGRMYYQDTLEHQLSTDALRAPTLRLRLVASHDLGNGWRSYDLSLLETSSVRLCLQHREIERAVVGDTLHLQEVSWMGVKMLLGQRSRWGKSLLAGGYTALGSGGQVCVYPVEDQDLLAHPVLFARRCQGRLLNQLEGLELKPTTKALLGALVLGELPRDELGRELRQSFVAGGVAHLLAVSGFHLGIIVALVMGLLRRLPYFRVHLYGRWVVVLLVAWSFTGLTGASIPTLRASGMLTLYVGARCLGRRPSFPEIIALPALIQLLLHPTSLWSASFLLTYGAMLGIYLFFRPLRQALGLLPSSLARYLWDGLAMTGAVLPFVLPLSLYLFGWVSLAFPWTTLITLPLASLLIPLGGMLLLLLPWADSLPPVLFRGLDDLASLLVESVRWAEGIPFLRLTYEISEEELLIYFAVLFLLLLWSRWREQEKLSLADFRS